MIRSIARRYSIRFSHPNAVTVTVERGGQKQDITLNIAQVADGGRARDLGQGSTARPRQQRPAAQPPPQSGGRRRRSNAGGATTNDESLTRLAPAMFWRAPVARLASSGAGALARRAPSIRSRGAEGATHHAELQGRGHHPDHPGGARPPARTSSSTRACSAKVTMLSSTPMTPEAFYQAFLSILQVYGFVAVPAGNVIKIIPDTDARQFPANDLPNSVSATSDEIVTQVIR